MGDLELFAELANSTIAQNIEWFASDLTVASRPKLIKMNLSTSASVTIQITFDGGATWVDFASTKKQDFWELHEFIVTPSDLINFRVSDVAGVTVQHFHGYYSD